MENKFKTIQPWISSVLNTIKKEIRTDHLASSPVFYRLHFGNRPLNRLTSEEIFTVYEKQLLQGDEDLGDWVTNRWVFKHGDVYQHFAERLSQIRSDFSAIENLTVLESEQVLEGAPESFGYLAIYIFSILNGVVFPEDILENLKVSVDKEQSEKIIELEKQEEELSLKETAARAQRELIALQKKYDNKIAGIMKKYTSDVEGLKKQIKSLQKQLHAVKVSV